ncbi:unnamed protein product [Schistocephalus solidus]|uniref:Uncharacterized protein n=1 Tax=Schistocephalus solidus TaxID=70667 RepID=A0A183SZ55_SCHSO|nr:unnamed protein product [Schistocephalus solidus]
MRPRRERGEAEQLVILMMPMMSVEALVGESRARCVPLSAQTRCLSRPQALLKTTQSPTLASCVRTSARMSHLAERESGGEWERSKRLGVAAVVVAAAAAKEEEEEEEEQEQEKRGTRVRGSGSENSVHVQTHASLRAHAAEVA